MVTKEEHLIREIMGTGKAGRLDTRIFAYAVQAGRRLMFQEGIPMENIHIIKSIYPKAGTYFGKRPKTAARAIECLGNRCWDAMTKEQRERYLGETERCLASKEILLLLAYYLEYGKSCR